MRKLLIAFLLFVVLVAPATWALSETKTGDGTPDGAVKKEETGQVEPQDPNPSTYYSQPNPQGPQGIQGEKGDPGPPPTQEEILEALIVFEAAKEKGYKIPSSFEALIGEATSRKIIVGFATPDGVDFKWGRNVKRAEMAQFVGRLLKVVDELEASSSLKDDQLLREISAVQGRLQEAQNNLQNQIAAEARERQAADITETSARKNADRKLSDRATVLEEKDMNAQKIAAVIATTIFIIFVVILAIKGPYRSR